MNRIPRTPGARRSRAGLLALAVLVALVALAGALVLAAPAGAATSSTVTSQNWSGYAAHGGATRFSDVTARWRIPAASCVTGEQSFSSFWVGIGGYSASSVGLEQDGTELDCNADGTQSVSAWYELLPAAPHTIGLKVASGDLISAGVHLDAHRVTLSVADLTTRKRFTKTITDHDVDDTSAEWIAEAPSQCSTQTSCSALALADFGAVRFRDASVTTTAGETSAITTDRWTTTKLLLGYEKQNGALVASTRGASATPTALTTDGTGFEVAWSGTQAAATSPGGSSATGSAGTGTTGGGTGSTGSGGGGDRDPGGGGGFGSGGGFGPGDAPGSGGGPSSGGGAGDF